MMLASWNIGWLMICAVATQAMTLQEAMQHAVDHNPSVMRAVKECMAAQAATTAARSGFLPVVNANASLGREKTFTTSTETPPEVSSVSLNRRDVGVEVRQSLFEGFSTVHNIERNEARTEAFAWNVVAEANDVALRAAEAYVNVLRQQALLQVAQENVATHRQTADMIERRTESGVSRQTDAVQSRGREAQANSNLITERGSLTDARIAFHRVVGQPSAALEPVEIPWQSLPQAEQQAVGMAVQCHPRLKSAQADVVEAHAQHQGTVSAFMPTVDAVALWENNRNQQGVVGPRDRYNTMLDARWNLFRGGADIARRRETAYLTQESVEIRNRTYRQLVENVRLAWSSFQTNQRLKKDFKQHVDAAKITIDAYSEQFQLGQRTLLDLLNSENEYFAAQKTYLNTQYDQLLSALRLLNGTGRLLSCYRIKLAASEVTDLSLDEMNEPRDHYFVHQKTMAPAKTTGPSKHADHTAACYTLQLLATNGTAHTERFISQHGLQPNAKTFKVHAQGKHWLVVTLGQYRTVATAKEALRDLPASLQRHTPWIRPLRGLEEVT